MWKEKTNKSITSYLFYLFLVKMVVMLRKEWESCWDTTTIILISFFLLFPYTASPLCKKMIQYYINPRKTKSRLICNSLAEEECSPLIMDVCVEFLSNSNFCIIGDVVELFIGSETLHSCLGQARLLSWWICISWLLKQHSTTWIIESPKDTNTKTCYIVQLFTI